MRQRAAGPAKHSCRLALWPRLRPWLTFRLLILHRQSCRLCSYLLYANWLQSSMSVCDNGLQVPNSTLAAAHSGQGFELLILQRQSCRLCSYFVHCQLVTKFHECVRQRAAGPTQHFRRRALPLRPRPWPTFRLLILHGRSCRH